MNPRPPHAMRTLSDEVVDLTDALVEYDDPDGLGVYRLARITGEDHERLVTALSRVEKYDPRLVTVETDNQNRVLVRFTTDRQRWDRTTFHLDAMWEAAAEKKPAKKAAKKTAKKST